MSRDDRIFILIFAHSFLVLGIVFCVILGFFFSFWSKAAIFLFGGYLAYWVIASYEILVSERKERKGQALPKLTIGDLIGLPFGAANPNDEIPKWIKVPILSILFLLVGVFVFFLVMILLTNLIAYFVS